MSASESSSPRSQTRAAPTGEELFRLLARRRANTELGLLVLAALVLACAAALLGLAQDRSDVLRELALYGGGLLGAAVIAHLVMRRVSPGGDPLLFPLAVLLNGLGLVMVRRIDLAYALRDSPPAPLAPAQGLWTLVGLAAFVAALTLLRDHRVLDRYRYSLGAASLLLLALPLLPVIGREINGARLWLQLGPLSFQPAEFAKLGLVVFFASYLADKRQVLSAATNRIGPVFVPPARAFAPVLVVVLASMAILVLQNDFGLSVLLVGLFVILLYVATSRVSYTLAGGGLFVLGALAAYQLAAHVQLRIAVWLDPWTRYETFGFQIAQSLFALGTGGLAGVGLGQGRPDFIPFVQTDFIFSAFGEELGLVGAVALLLCYFLLIARGFAIALRSREEFATLLALGLTALFALQVFVILAGVTRLIPLTGLTLPFLSYGGSSLLANYILIAVLLRLSARQTAAAAGAHTGELRRRTEVLG